MSEQLKALLERIEAATGPDREIDSIIEATFFAPEGWHIEQSPINGNWCIYSGTNARTGQPRLWEAKGHSAIGKPYTASIDAAVALVEKKLDGWGWQTGCPLPYSKPREFYASVWRNGLHVGHDGWVNEDGKPMPPRPSPAIYRSTPALALLCALLRALIAEQQS